MDQAKTLCPLVPWMQEPHQIAVVVCLLLIPEQADQGVSSLDNQGRSEFDTLSKLKTEHVIGE